MPPLVNEILTNLFISYHHTWILAFHYKPFLQIALNIIAINIYIYIHTYDKYIMMQPKLINIAYIVK